MKTIIARVSGEVVAIERARGRKVASVVRALREEYPRARIEVCEDSTLKEELD